MNISHQKFYFFNFLSKQRKANQGRTEIIRNDLNPVWNYKTVFSIFRKNIQIQIQVKEQAKNLIPRPIFRNFLKFSEILYTVHTLADQKVTRFGFNKILKNASLFGCVTF